MNKLNNDGSLMQVIKLSIPFTGAKKKKKMKKLPMFNPSQQSFSFDHLSKVLAVKTNNWRQLMRQLLKCCYM